MTTQTPTTTATAYFFNGTTDNTTPSITFNQTTNLLPRLSQTIKVHDLRHRNPPASLSTTKCEFLPWPTTLLEQDLKSDNPATKHRALTAYYAECARLVQSQTKCSRAMPFHHRHREQVPTQAGNAPALHDAQSFANKPVATFHVDNDPSTAERHLRRMVGDEEAEREWLHGKKRWAIVNVWRPVGEMVQQLPLALAVRDDNLHAGGGGGNVSESDTVQIRTPGNYKTHFIGIRPLSEARYTFWYASRMEPDEALLFVDYDSEAGGVSGVAHGAVEDHGSLAGAPLRRSIEVRVLILYD